MSAEPDVDLSTTSLVPPPPGEVSNFKDPVSNEDFRPVYISIIILGGIFVAVRLYTRRFISHSIGLDDYASGLGLFFTLVFFGLLYVLTRDYLRHHAWDYPISYLLPRFFKIDLAAFVFYVPANVCVKSSIFLLYIRVFGSLKYVRRVAWFMVAFTVAFHLASLVVIIFACNPRSKLLNPLIPGKCINKHHLTIPSSGLNIFTDLVAFVLPTKAVLDLNASRHQKIQVLALFATGLFGCVLGMLRLMSFTNAARTDDFTWYGYITLKWTIVELNVAMICACAPALRPFFRHHFANATFFLSRSDPKSNAGLSHAKSAHFVDPKARYVHVAETIDQTIELREPGRPSNQPTRAWPNPTGSKGDL
ncbi:MAG: hypothetical protein M1815_000033 [Lichina confinis]|nr:MAG: hypothetical protein M1815_000033 [Lichina confinis]